VFSTSGAAKQEHPLIERFFDIRPQELGRVLLMSSYLLLIIAAYSTTKAVRDSLFVTKIGPAQLPYVYLMIAGAMGLVSVVYTRAVARFGLRRLIRTTSLIAISNLLLFWLLFKQNSGVWFYVLYVWVSLFGAITASQFWLLATHVFNPREARRVFAWLGVGGILGGILGGALTNRVANWFGTESLLILCAAMMAATILLLERAAGFAKDGVEQDSASGDSGKAPSGKALFQQVRESQHLRLMVLLLIVAVIVEAFIDYEYKYVAKQSFASKDHLTAFFGTITFYIGIFSLLFQMFVTNRIMKRGVGWAIMMLPAGLLVSFIALAVHPKLWAAALLQLVDGGLSYSIHRSGMELLYLPIPPQTRNAVKGFIDMFVDRTGRAIGAVLLLACTVILTFSIPALSIVAAFLVIAWIAMVIAVKREYLHSFRLALEKSSIEPEALQLRNLDRGTARTLIRLLDSDDERQVLYALDLLSNTHPNRWRDQISMLIRHPSAAVRARTIALLASWNDPLIARDAFIHHPDYETARVAMAGALRFYWTGSFRDRESLDGLLRDSSPAVVRQAMVTAAMVKYEDAVPFLIEKLADRHFRRDARAALAKFGNSIIADLVARLLDSGQPGRIRMRIPKTLALAGTPEAAEMLLRCLHQVEYHVDYAVLKALNRMRGGFPKIRLDRARVIRAIYTEREAYDRLLNVHGWLLASAPEGPVFQLLTRAVAERMGERLERIFRLVGLIYPPNDIYAAYYNWQMRPAMRASAIEFLDNLLDTRMKELIIPLLEEGGPRPARAMSRQTVFGTLLKGEDPWLSTIVMELVSNETGMQYLNAG
jgi:ATP/ADP translocase